MMSTPNTIEPRYGAEVYVGDQGHVCIQQYRDSKYTNDHILIMHRDEIPALIKCLRATYRESRDFIPAPEPAPRDD